MLNWMDGSKELLTQRNHDSMATDSFEISYGNEGTQNTAAKNIALRIILHSLRKKITKH